MCQDRLKRVSTKNIDRKLSSLSDTFNEPLIFKIHRKLRCQNEDAYEPQMFSIGPYHHGKSNSKESEKYKLWYLKELLARTGESSAEKYMLALMEVEERARSCYAEEIHLSSNDFVEMMCVDGCFVIEFLRKFGAVRNRYDPINYYPSGDPLFQRHWLIGSLIRDMLLFENQLPFFVLVKLFDMTKLPNSSACRDLIDLLNFPESPIYEYFPGDQKSAESNFNRIRADEVHHLLDLVHKIWCSSFTENLIASARATGAHDHISDSSMNSDTHTISSVSELQLSGVKFERATRPGVSWLDITFENGVIKIPPLNVHDVTECVLRNLIAYEEYMPSDQEDRKCVHDYITFMDCLIDSSEDVTMLRRCQIINKWLADDEAVSNVFNKLGSEVDIDVENFRYFGVFKQVNQYSCRRWNKWRAYLMKQYFNNPWSIISFLAALLLLILTSLQTIFTIMPYKY